MADSCGLTDSPQAFQSRKFIETAHRRINTEGSVAMEQSASTSSVSSSVTSFLTSTSSTSIQSSAYMPTTPNRTVHTFDPVRNSNNNNNNNNNNKASNDIAFFGGDSTLPPKMTTIKESLDISLLMSPPDPERIDNFSKVESNGSTNHTTAFSPTQVGPQAQTHTAGNGSKTLKSEMISPVSLGADDVGLDDTGSAQDPILFPDSTPSLNSRPLFADNEAAIISNHIAARQPALFRQVSPPHGEDYELAVRIKSQVMQRYLADRHGWLAQQREQLRADNRAAAERRKRLQLPAPVSRPVFTQPAPRNLSPRTSKVQAALQPAQSLSSHHGQSTLSRLVQDSTKRVNKRVSRAPALQRNSLPARIAPHVNGALRQSPGNGQSTSRVPGSSPEPRIRTTPPNREDKDFNSLPDYCPSLTTLPERTNLLRVEWKGTPIDLSRDPFSNLLHPDELVLAAGLRLDCATYLTSKRRIFIRRLECARMPKEFRKTDAQQACNIDVNKASKLWSAYDKVGWLRIEHFRKFL